MLIVPVLSALVLGGRFTATQRQLTLRYMPPVGKVFRYTVAVDTKMAASSSSPAAGMTITVDMTDKILSRTGDITNVQTSLNNPKVSVPSNSPMAMVKDTILKELNGKVFTVKYNSRHENKGTSGGGMDSTTSSLQSITFPPKPLTVGTSWTTNVDMSKLMGGGLSGGMVGGMSGKIPVTYKLTGITQRGGHAVALVHIVMVGTVDVKASGQAIKLRLNGSGNAEIDAATGVTLSTKVSSVNNVSFAGMTIQQHQTQTLTLK